MYIGVFLLGFPHLCGCLLCFYLATSV